MRESLLSGRETLFAPPTARPGEGFLDFSEAQKALIDQARKHYGEIWPCARKSWEECFTRLPNGEICFWFNSIDGSTRILRQSDLEKSVWQGVVRPAPASRGESWRGV